jgi:hypothetical protein
MSPDRRNQLYLFDTALIPQNLSLQALTLNRIYARAARVIRITRKPLPLSLGTV